CVERVCVTQAVSTATGSSSTGGNQGCVSSEKCTEDNSGQPYICRKVGDPCVSLLSEDCTNVYGDYSDPNAIILGMVSSYSGDIVKTFMKTATHCTAQTMIADFDNNVVGLPSAAGVRPLAVVACGEEADTERAAKHLIDDVGVKIVLGPLFGDALKV